MNVEQQIKFWDIVNEIVTVSGGDAGACNTARQEAVVKMEKFLLEIVNKEKELLQSALEEIHDREVVLLEDQINSAETRYARALAERDEALERLNKLRDLVK